MAASSSVPSLTPARQGGLHHLWPCSPYLEHTWLVAMTRTVGSAHRNTTQLIDHYGYWAVFVFVAAQRLGGPIPGETAVLAAGVQMPAGPMSSTMVDFRRRLWPPLLGNMVGYWTRAKVGWRWLARYGPKIHLDERRLKVGRTHSTARVKKWFLRSFRCCRPSCRRVSFPRPGLGGSFRGVEDTERRPFPHPHRLFPAEPTVRDLAIKLYEQVTSLPLISPHGHVDAALLADDAPYADPVALLVRPDHYVLRLLHAHGVPLTDLGVADRTAPGPVAGPREVWHQLCRNWAAFRGTAMRLWLEDELADLFGIDGPLEDKIADQTYDHITEQLGRPEFRPRASTGASASRSWLPPIRL